jgi:hypothetical protein
MRLSIKLQIGDYEGNPEFNFPEIKLRNQTEFNHRLEKWRNGINSEIKRVMNALMALPKQYADFEKKHFYTDARPLLPALKLSGFKSDLKDSEKTRHRYLTLTYSASQPLLDSWNNESRNISYFIEITTIFPNSYKSWSEFLENERARIVKKRVDRSEKRIPLNGADAALATHWERKDFYNRKSVAKRVTIYSVNECFKFIKNNVRVYITGSGGGLSSPKLDTIAIAKAVLAQCDKKSVK